MGITETWLDNTISDGEVQIPGYRLFRHDRQGKAGGGVCIYVHHSVKVRLLPLGHLCSEIEMLWIAVTLGKVDYNVGYLYRLPNAPAHFWSDLDNALEDLAIIGSETMLLGDINVDLLNPNDHNYKHLKSVCCPLQLENIVSNPTRFSANSAKCLDPVLTNIPNVSAPGVEHLDFSDHALVLSGIVINDYNNKLSPKLKSKRLWRVSTLANPVDLETAIDHHMQNLTSSGMP